MKRSKRRNQQPQPEADRESRLTWMHLPERKLPPADELRLAYAKRGEAEATVFAESVDFIDRSVTKTNPLSLLSSFSTYFLTSLTRKHEIDEGVPMVQAHGELLQAMILRHAWNEFGSEQHPSQALHSIGIALANASRAFSGQRVGNLVRGSLTVDSARAAVIEFVRSVTQLSRNWGYSYQTFRVLRDLLAPLGPQMKGLCGATAEELLDLFTVLTTLVEGRLNHALDVVRKARATPAPDRIVSEICKGFGISQHQTNELRETVRQCAQPSEACEAAVFICLDALLPLVHLCSWEDFRAACPAQVSDKDLRQFLDKWSLTFGSLAGTDIAEYFLNNPVWTRPLIAMDSSMWYLPFPSLFFSFCWELVDGIFSPDASIRRRYSARRSEYLETAIATEFQRAFPMASIQMGNYWTDPLSGTIYENDLMVRVNSVLFIIEAKSGALHASARRGGALRLEKAIKELIIEPARQARRLEAVIGAQAVEFRASNGAKREFDLRGVETVVCWSITLDTVADVSAMQVELLASEWIPRDLVLPPSMSLSDLQNVFELLDGYCLKLHYLSRRADWTRSARYMGDELDLLAVYFDTLFEIGEGETDGTRIMAYGASRTFERYFLELEQQRKTKKPRPRLTRWWSNMLSYLERRLPEQWSEIGLELLNISADDQQRFGEAMRVMRSSVLQGDTAKDTVIFVSAASRRVAIVGVIYLDNSRKDRDAKLMNRASQAKFADGRSAERVLVIGCDPRIPSTPYSALALVGFDPEPSVVEGE